ncbi:arsenate reductase (glutaredoxin) [Notoacmeibacter sp. MSK16QG-6]|uniref:arsenate reductase (glutaredoxin) n=1 Tax=Notoacmeibacter sp. MSK16QG-6 TaxID=2957982 RepID=UPI0020A09897|nr:arsenate reductase (glutaredoxin) [Notoacmeibacter sp. MSK16QG-6]MCP1198630.1 arsenate reductase (glutaredoxin) [Notoacmeibacter sp. MSK16QG-6]
MQIVIHHNPACGTSRNVVAMVREAGFEPVIIEYLKTGWSKPQLQALFAAAGLKPHEALRVKGTDAEERGLTEASVDDETLLEAMVENPIFVNRPIVCSSRGVRLCRPSEMVLDLLPPGALDRFVKEDGEEVRPSEG